MCRTIAALALIVLTSAFAAAQTGVPAKKIDPKAIAPGVKTPTQIPNQANLPNPNAGNLQVDPSKLFKHNLRVGDVGVVINEAAGTVTVTVQNLGTVQENSVAVRLGIADAIDGPRSSSTKPSQSGQSPQVVPGA